jgi:hypothetical protein
MHAKENVIKQWFYIVIHTTKKARPSIPYRILRIISRRMLNRPCRKTSITRDFVPT